MTPATSFAGHKVALFGLGGSGLATALALKAGGADVTAWDDAEASRAKAAAQGITVADLHEADWPGFAALILSPGVPLTHPAPHWTAALARKAGIEVIGDIELFCRERAKLAPASPFIAITGTNGKSTTTALIAHVLREAGHDVQMGGNIGIPILALEPPADNRVHVVEMSSFQIDLTPSLNPSVGLMLNLSPDHLDRHGTMENYAAIKERLVAQADAALIGIDDALSRDMASRLEARGTAETYPVSAEHPLGSGFFAEGTRIRARMVGQEDVGEEDEDLEFGDLAGIGSLRGRHNAQNAAFAAASAWLCGVSPEQIASAFRTFPGLPHRMEEVGRIGRALFVNDSKATNADSTEKALTSFDHVFWILGGKQKEGGIAALEPYFSRIIHAYLIGEAADSFAATLDGKVPFTRSGTLDRAVAQAAQDAARSGVSEPVVLLSPACASYDQFPNFGVRGDHFRDLVRALPGFEPTIPASGPEHQTASEPTLATPSTAP